MDMLPMDQARERLQKILTGYQASAILMSAAELDVFTPILQCEQGIDAESTAKKLKFSPRATTILLDALCALGFLEKKTGNPTTPGLYSVPAGFTELLDAGHPLSFIPMIRHSANCMRQWGQLARTVKSGVLTPKQASILGPCTDMESFISAMNSHVTPTMDTLVKRMQEAGLFPFTHLLDIGSGPGSHTVAFLKANPGTKATLFDLPAGIQVAKRRIQKEKLEDRVAFVEGDFYRDTLPGGVDFVWLSAIIHQHGREESRELYKKIHTALQPGGRLAVRDVFMKSGRTEPVFGALFAINMLANTESGMTYTFEEVEEDLKSAGLGEVKLAIPSEDMNSVIVATRGP